jgi:hypothetical protein
MAMMTVMLITTVANHSKLLHNSTLLPSSRFEKDQQTKFCMHLVSPIQATRQERQKRQDYVNIPLLLLMNVSEFGLQRVLSIGNNTVVLTMDNNKMCNYTKLSHIQIKEIHSVEKSPSSENNSCSAD